MGLLPQGLVRLFPPFYIYFNDLRDSSEDLNHSTSAVPMEQQENSLAAVSGANRRNSRPARLAGAGYNCPKNPRGIDLRQLTRLQIALPPECPWETGRTHVPGSGYVFAEGFWQ